jgi:hypothetical protein
MLIRYLFLHVDSVCLKRMVKMIDINFQKISSEVAKMIGCA